MCSWLAGIASVGSTCRSYFGAALSNDIGLGSAIVVAHEIAHTLVKQTCLLWNIMNDTENMIVSVWTLSKSRRLRQQERGETEFLLNRIALRLRFETEYNSQPSYAELWMESREKVTHIFSSNSMLHFHVILRKWSDDPLEGWHIELLTRIFDRNESSFL